MRRTSKGARKGAGKRKLPSGGRQEPAVTQRSRKPAAASGTRKTGTGRPKRKPRY